MNTRKSSRLRSNMSIIPNSKFFRTTDEDIEKLENIIGFKLSASNKGKLQHILDLHFGYSYSSANAPFVDEVENELLAIQEAAKRLNSILNNRSNAAQLVAAERLNNDLNNTIPETGLNTATLTAVLSCISTSCERQAEEAKSSAQKWDGHDEWDRTIIKLTDFFSDLGLEIGATADPKASIFVLFIAEFHKVLPDVAIKRGEQSHIALAQAIKRARKAEKDRKLEEARSECPAGTASTESHPFGVQSDQKER